MKTIRQSVSAEITEKKSKFISELFYVESVKEAESKIEEINKKYHDAKHHCFAYRILDENHIVERASDDGEPSGTAGAPMLQLLSKSELVNVLVVVTRYFGGVLLGTGGLVRAYSKATSDGIEKAEIATLEQGEIIKVPVSYKNLAFLQYYCKKNNITILETNFEGELYVIIEITEQEKGSFLYEMKEKQFDIEKIELLEKRYICHSIKKYWKISTFKTNWKKIPKILANYYKSYYNFKSEM